MRKNMYKNRPQNCPSCGAPVVSEICAYCGRATGLRTAEADMEYPILECKEATISFWTVGFPMIFAGSFGVIGLIMLVIALTSFGEPALLAVGLPFFLIGAAALFFALRPIIRSSKIKSKGIMIRATVYGYMDDGILINGRPAQIVKLLVRTQGGPRFILYQLGNTLRPYGINDVINIMVYKNYFMICKNKEVIQW